MAIKLKQRTIEELKKIIQRDCKISINDEQSNGLGVCLLRLSRLALVGLTRLNKEKPCSKKQFTK